MTFTRGAGSWSTQTAAAVNGTTFISTGTAQNTARFAYNAALGKRALQIEPTRTNLLPDSNMVDTAVDDVPDGWTHSAGTAGVDYNTITPGAPHAGAYWQRENTAVIGGIVDSINLAALTAYAVSTWARPGGVLGAGNHCLGIYTNPGYPLIALPAGSYDWVRVAEVLTTVGASAADNAFYQVPATPGCAVACALPNVEAGLYATSFIPTTGGAGARAAELCAVDAAVVGQASGYVGMVWMPGYASTAFATHANLFTWAPNWWLEYDGADDKLKVIVNGVECAESAALAFAAGSLHSINVRYGASGHALTVDGLTTTNPAAWGAPVLAPYLGSRAASANCEAAQYADLLLAA
jgi:hypothetical protein